MARRKSASTKDSTAQLGFEAKLWLAADKLRNNMDAAEYKHVVHGLIFRKSISVSFEAHRITLEAGEGDYAGAEPEDPIEYDAENVVWVPTEARWAHLQTSAKLPADGPIFDEDSLVAPERYKRNLKAVPPKDTARASLDKPHLGERKNLLPL